MLLHNQGAAQSVSGFTAASYGAPLDRAALDALGAAVLLPISRGNSLAAVICLGHKRSGDVYIGTDLALLTAAAHAISRELRRFDEMGKAPPAFSPAGLPAK